MRKSSFFIIYCLLFVFGILWGNFLKISFDAFYVFVLWLINLVFSIIFWPKKKISLVFLGLVFLFLGAWRYQISLFNINPQHIAYYNNYQIEFIGQVVNEPDIRDKYRKVVLGKILKLPDYYPLAGKVLINLSNYPAHNYGDWLKINCQLKKPVKINDFDYEKYLAVKGIYTLCTRVNTVDLIKGHNLTIGQKTYKQILKIKYKFKQTIDLTVAYPQNEILSAIILGLRHGVPPTVLSSFKASGLSHIIAISGLHISIISLLLMNLFIVIGFQRRSAFYLSAISLFLFILIIGFRVSSLRAAIMGLAALLAMQIGRLNKSINILMLAACLLLLINPKLLLDDIGFQLSFLAVIGIIYLGEPINNLLDKLHIPESFEVKSSLMMTLSAQVMVLPLIIYYFGNLSLVAPLANILVLPLLPIIIILGFSLGLAGFIFWPLAKSIGLIISLLIKWIIYISQSLINLPYANFLIIKFDLVWLLIIYMILVWLIWFHSNKKLTINL